MARPQRWLLLCALAGSAVACAGGTMRRTVGESTAEPAPELPARDGDGWYARSGATDSSAADRGPAGPLEVEADCDGPIPVYAAGVRTEVSVCEQSERFTIVSLADDWTPTIFAVDPAMSEEGEPPYRDEYVALANEDFDALDDPSAARHYLELLGISPTVDVLIDRLRDSERHDCHAAIDDEPLQRLDEGTGATSARPSAEVHADSRRAVAAIETAQRHLVCDRLLVEGEFERGDLDEETGRALRLFQRKQMIVGAGHLGESTVGALAMDSREQDFRAVLRMLRERVVDATDLLADGSARGAWAKVLDRVLDPPAVRSTSGQPPAPGGAPDRVSQATEAAAVALGLTDPETAANVLIGLSGRVAVELPRMPTYDREGGDQILWVEVHRGEARPGVGPNARRAVLTVYASQDDEPVALVRWATTIGGFEEVETSTGRVRTRFFESPTGRRIWRRLIAGPTWLPPHDTPDETFIRGDEDDWELDTTIIGPGYDSAYGLMVLVHERPEPGGELIDEGIRTHGSVDYHSILRGSSHGCHRVYNHLAVRLGGHLLARRRHRREGNESVVYRHVVDHGGETRAFEVSSRGYRYDFVRPVPVLVIDGEAPGPDDSPSQEAALRPE